MTVLRAGSGGGGRVGQGVVRLRVRGLAVNRERVSLFDAVLVIIYGSPEAAACLACVEVPAPASARTEARSGAGGHGAAWARGGAPPLVGDDVDPHPHVREALHMSLIELFRLSFYHQGFTKILKLIVIEKRYLIRMFGCLETLTKWNPSRAKIRLDRYLIFVTELSNLNGKRV